MTTTRRLRLAVVNIVRVFCLVSSQFSSATAQRPTLPQHSEVLYGVDEESPVGTKVGRGLKLDAGLVDKYSPEVLKLLGFRFLSRVSDFVAISRDGQLEIVGRADREAICAPKALDGSRDDDDELCQVRLDVAVQPMKYFHIIKVRTHVYAHFCCSLSYSSAVIG